MFNFYIFRFIFLPFFVFSQWTEIELRQIVEQSNQRALQIEQMTKEAAIKQNQMFQQLNGENGSFRPAIVEGIPTEFSSTKHISSPSNQPTIEDDRTFLKKMAEQESLVSQLNSIAARDMATRTGILAMEASLIQALRPLTLPFFGAPQPIPGHFIPFQQVPRQIEESPKNLQIDIGSRPDNPQLPMRKEVETSGLFEYQNDSKNENVTSASS